MLRGSITIGWICVFCIFKALQTGPSPNLKAIALRRRSAICPTFPPFILHMTDKEMDLWIVWMNSIHFSKSACRQHLLPLSLFGLTNPSHVINCTLWKSLNLCKYIDYLEWVADCFINEHHPASINRKQAPLISSRCKIFNVYFILQQNML